MTCPWCGNSDFVSSLYYPEAFIDMRGCKHCGTVFGGPGQSTIDYSKYNRPLIESRASGLRADYEISEQGPYLFSRLLEAIGEPPQADFSLLDIGAGPGDFLAELKHAYPRVEVHGVEPSAYNVSAARSKHGLELQQGYWGDVEVRDIYDVATIFGSLMLHPDPKRSLSRAVDRLKTKGWLLFDFKNVDSATRALLRAIHPLIPKRRAAHNMYRQAFHGMPVGLQPSLIVAFLDELGVDVVRIRQRPGRNSDIGKNRSGMAARASNILDKCFGAQAWVEVVARRR